MKFHHTLTELCAFLFVGDDSHCSQMTVLVIIFHLDCNILCTSSLYRT